jgi:hypothetical protein
MKGAIARPFRAAIVASCVVFLLSYIILFLGMSRLPNMYDEGLVLTAAMRVAAGQIPHRDFYANYGPAQFYILAGLFKLFGESILVERIYDLAIKALVVTSLYAVTSSYCRPIVAACTATVGTMWLLSLRVTATPVVPVSVLGLASSGLLVPVLLRAVSTRRLFAVGLLAGGAALFRYDCGGALCAIDTCVIAFAACLRATGMSDRLQSFKSSYWPYVLGFLVPILPVGLCYLSVAPLQPFVHDIIIYPTRYYAQARRLPFPAVFGKWLYNLEIYLPLVTVAIAVCVLVMTALRQREGNKPEVRVAHSAEDWQAFLVTFALLTLVMYFKGLVRVDSMQMYLSIICSLPVVAVLFQQRSKFAFSARLPVVCLALVTFLTAARSCARQTKILYREKLSLLASVGSSARPAWVEKDTAWCEVKSPLTRGLCFYPEEDRLKTIQFIANHTRPGDELFVGVPNHDKIFANDNLIYFASQRLPATKWSHFDPGLQNSYEVQTEMVRELSVNAPPYIVLDSEFEVVHEPNDSSKSTGVTLLDDYLRSRYRPTATFGVMSVWQRISPPGNSDAH